MRVRFVALLAAVLIVSMFAAVPMGSASTLYLWDCRKPANKHLAECNPKPIPTNEHDRIPDATSVPTVVAIEVPSTPVVPVATSTPVATRAVPVSAAPATSGNSSSPDNHSSWIKVCAWEASTEGGTYNPVSRDASTKNVATLPYVENHVEGQDYRPYKNEGCKVPAENAPVAASVPAQIEVESVTAVPVELATETPAAVATSVPIPMIDEFVPEAVPAPDVPATEDEAPLPVMPLGLPDTGDGSTYNPYETP